MAAGPSLKKASYETPITNQVFFPANFQELFAVWNRFPDAEPFAGGSGFIHPQGKRLPKLPGNIISLEKLDELKRITRTERYLELGAMVKMNEILNLGKIVPEILIRTLEGIANFHIRNTTTIGGNLCDKVRRLDCSAPMAALDAHFELRNASSARWISGSRFFAAIPPALSPQELLTRIRIPLDQWNYSLYRKFNDYSYDESSDVIVFILKNQKNMLTDLRVVFSGEHLLQNRQNESHLIGKHLPLDRKDAALFLDKWQNYIKSIEINEFTGVQIMNFLERAVFDITD